MGSIVVPVDDRLYSTLEIGSDEFPFQLFHDDLDHFARGFVNWHKQKEIEISFVLEGGVRVCLLREEHELRAGDCFILLPDALHSLQPVASKPGKYFTLIFDPCLLTGFAGSFFEKSCYCPIVASGQSFFLIDDTPALCGVRENILAIYDHGDHPDDTQRLLIQRRLQDIWLTLLEEVFPCAAQKSRAHEDARILEMLDYLRSHYAEKFSLTLMAEHLHVSRGECCRYFRRMMGMTITEYLIDYRLSKAAELLTLTRMHMTDIAHSVGFGSASGFAAEFKKKTGCTPTQYRADGKT